MAKRTALRGTLISFIGNPFVLPLEACLEIHEDGLLVMENGKICASGDAAQLLPDYPALDVQDYRGQFILAGFIDAHVHYPQIPMLAAYGKQLIEWLQTYTFPTERLFADADFARQTAEVYLREQIKNGVTTAVVFSTVYPQSVAAIFSAAAARDLRLLAGKVCMDVNAPEALCDTPQRAYDESKALINQWHGKGRLEYVITPRFAPTSSAAQLEMLGALAQEYPDMAIQSHISENVNEVAWVKSLFPQAQSYTDVYAHAGLLRPRAIYGHGIHLSEAELQTFHDTGAAIAHCPTSNFFLGSGCFSVAKAKAAARPVALALGTDLGAGTSFSMLQTMAEAYKAGQMVGHAYPAWHYFYLATLGGAQALGIDAKIGNLAVGKEADVVVLNPEATELLAYRQRFSRTLAEKLFCLMMLGDDRCVRQTFVAGKAQLD